MDMDTSQHEANGFPLSEFTTYTTAFEPTPCPIAWPATQAASIHANYPFFGIDPESQAAEDYATRKYVETLWLPNSIFPLESFVRDLGRLVVMENQSSTTPVFLHSLIQHILLDRKAVKIKYMGTIPDLLQTNEVPGNEEERMIFYAKALERKPCQNCATWLERFHCREYQIQILLYILLLLYPLPPPTSSSRRRSPKKKRRKELEPKMEITFEYIQDILLILVSGLSSLADSGSEAIQSDGIDDGGWLSKFCEQFIAPMLQVKLPHIYDLCVLALCPSKYQSPMSSPSSSPGPSNSLLPTLDPEGTRPQHRHRKSRSPSIAQTERSIIEAPPSRNGSVAREFARARSGSLLSEEVTARARVSRGGVVTSHSMFARQVDMRKSAQESKGQEKVRQRVTSGNGKPPPPQPVIPSRRIFARATTLPIKPLPPAKPIMLVAATPVINRTRSVSMEMDLEGSPDSLRLSPEYEDKKTTKQNVLVPDTPMKC